MKIKIHQIYFNPKQQPQLDAAFTPYDNSACPNPDSREFYVFRKEYLEGHIGPEDYTGYVSWRFGEKTGTTGNRFIEFCQANPGYDVYFINPFPLEIYWGNVWQQGEVHHPGLLAVGQELFDRVSKTSSNNKMPKMCLSDLPPSFDKNSFCNFWVGNKKFWDAYMEFCLPFWDLIFNQLTTAERAKIFASRDKRTRATYVSFFFERLFTTTLLIRPDIRSLQYSYNGQEIDQLYPKPNEAELAKQLLQYGARSSEGEFKLDGLLKVGLAYYQQEHRPPTVRRLVYYFLKWCWYVLPLRGILKIGFFNELHGRLRQRHFI